MSRPTSSSGCRIVAALLATLPIAAGAQETGGTRARRSHRHRAEARAEPAGHPDRRHRVQRRGHRATEPQQHRAARRLHAERHLRHHDVDQRPELRCGDLHPRHRPDRLRPDHRSRRRHLRRRCLHVALGGRRARYARHRAGRDPARPAGDALRPQHDGRCAQHHLAAARSRVRRHGGADARRLRSHRRPRRGRSAAQRRDWGCVWLRAASNATGTSTDCWWAMRWATRTASRFAPRCCGRRATASKLYATADYAQIDEASAGSVLAGITQAPNVVVYNAFDAPGNHRSRFRRRHPVRRALHHARSRHDLCRRADRHQSRHWRRRVDARPGRSSRSRSSRSPLTVRPTASSSVIPTTRRSSSRTPATPTTITSSSRRSSRSPAKWARRFEYVAGLFYLTEEGTDNVLRAAGPVARLHHQPGRHRQRQLRPSMGRRPGT